MDIHQRLADLERRNKLLEAEVERLRTKLAGAEAEVRRLRGLLDESERGKHRQSVRFPKRERVAEPGKPGRRKGHRADRRPRPERVERTLEAPLGPCPDCGVEVDADRVHEQFQVDLPPIRPTITQFNVHVGRCPCCGKRVQGRHPEQISDALGAAGVQIGPTLLTMAAELKHRLGVTYRKISDFYSSYLDVEIAPSTLCRASQRLANKAKPTYDLLLDALRRCDVVHADETGWRVGRLNSWLWVFSSDDVTIYAIRSGEGARGKGVPKEILGDDFDGVLVVDGLASYDALECKKGRCVGHVLRRAHDLETAAAPNDARYLRKLIDIFKDAIAMHDIDGPISEREYWNRVEGIEERLDEWLTFFGYKPSGELIKLVKHLRAHREEWLRFLYEPDVPPTNNHAERMIRPAVILRRIGSCNRSLRGALAHEVLASLMVTCRQRGEDLLETMMAIWRSPLPHAVDLFADPVPVG